MDPRDHHHPEEASLGPPCLPASAAHPFQARLAHLDRGLVRSILAADTLDSAVLLFHSSCRCTVLHIPGHSRHSHTHHSRSRTHLGIDRTAVVAAAEACCTAAEDRRVQEDTVFEAVVFGALILRRTDDRYYRIGHCTPWPRHTEDQPSIVPAFDLGHCLFCARDCRKLKVEFVKQERRRLPGVKVVVFVSQLFSWLVMVFPNRRVKENCPSLSE